MGDDRFNLLKSEKLKNNRGRKWVNLNDVEESSDESSIELNDDASSSYSDESFNELDDEDIVDVDFDNLVKNAQSTSDSTTRLAVMHFDFDQYPLSYLANIIKYALPKNGKIKSITKYPSQEYMDRYHDDIKYGPKEYLKSEENDDKDYDSDASYDSQKANKVYRKYQISRLKFFYAIFEFDTIETADSIYNMLDEKNLGDSGLKLDLRYVDGDKKFEIPDEFLHLIEKLRPNFSKFKAVDFKPSCFSELKAKDMWDVVPQKEEFNLHAFEVSDNELSDVEKFYREDTASEFSGSEAESNNESDSDGPKIKRFRRQRLDVEEYRALLGLSEVKENNESGGGVEEDIEEEVESIGGSDNESGMEGSDEYVINEEEAGDEEEEEEEDMSDSEGGNNGDQAEMEKPNEKKKISHREKMKSILKEKLQKKKSKQKEIREYLKSAVGNNEDRFDEFLFLPQNFKLTVTNAHYESGKLFVEMMKYRAANLGVVPDFVVPAMSDDDDDGDDDEHRNAQGAPNQPRKRNKHSRKHSLSEPDLKKIKI